THAARPPVGAAVNAVGNAELIACAMLKRSAAPVHRQLNVRAKPATNTRKRMDSVIPEKRSGASRSFHRDASSRPARWVNRRTRDIRQPNCLFRQPKHARAEVR